ncbi:MAG: hypothetical protein ACREYE_21635, partial [Gammaproteobacteria bacterium]
YFTLSAKVQHIVELAGLDEAPVDTALRTLANRSLVVPDQEETAYALVPMVADFLRRKRPEAVAEIGSRLGRARLRADRGERLRAARPLPGTRCQLAHCGSCTAALRRRAE